MLPVAYHPRYDAPSVPDGHRFPMRKYARLAARLAAAPFAGRIDWRTPEPAPRAAVERAHAPAYVEAVLTQTVEPKLARRIGFPVTADVAERAMRSAGGTLLAARAALRSGLAASVAGGSHHAGPEGGAGFCVFNDVAVAALDLLATGEAERVLIVDCDVHHGDGTARILAAEPRAFTLSLHCEANWPIEKPPSDLDVALPKGAGDEAYLAALEPALAQAIEAQRPQLVLYNAGVDPHADDRLGLLGLSDEGLRARDAQVIAASRAAGAALAAVLGGGYGPDADAVAARHFILFEELVRALD
jgi:acetoin utilization deacetylase AcuC-like enzyme